MFQFVMPGLVRGIHVFKRWRRKDVDGRDKPGHDGEEISARMPGVTCASDNLAVPAHVVDGHDAKRGHDQRRHQNLKCNHCRPCRMHRRLVRPLVAIRPCYRPVPNKRKDLHPARRRSSAAVKPAFRRPLKFSRIRQESRLIARPCLDSGRPRRYGPRASCPSNP